MSFLCWDGDDGGRHARDVQRQVAEQRRGARLNRVPRHQCRFFALVFDQDTTNRLLERQVRPKLCLVAERKTNQRVMTWHRVVVAFDALARHASGGGGGERVAGARQLRSQFALRTRHVSADADANRRQQTLTWRIRSRSSAVIAEVAS